MIGIYHGLMGTAGLLLICTLSNAKPSPQQEIKAPVASSSEDGIKAAVEIAPDLNTPWFQTRETSLPFHIVEHEDGSVESTTGNPITPADLLRIEHTAKCISTHMGEHEMSFCDATLAGKEVRLEFSGGLPAYASTLSVKIGPEGDFHCSFNAASPGLTHAGWKIRKKSLRLKSGDFKERSRLYGWISIEFDEIDRETGKVSPHKIEGYFKPVILQAPAAE